MNEMIIGVNCKHSIDTVKYLLTVKTVTICKNKFLRPSDRSHSDRIPCCLMMAAALSSAALALAQRRTPEQGGCIADRAQFCSCLHKRIAEFVHFFCAQTQAGTRDADHADDFLAAKHRCTQSGHSGCKDLVDQCVTAHARCMQKAKQSLEGANPQLGRIKESGSDPNLFWDLTPIYFGCQRKEIKTAP